MDMNYWNLAPPLEAVHQMNNFANTIKTHVVGILKKTNVTENQVLFL